MKDGIAISLEHVTKRFPLTAIGGSSLKHMVIDTFRRRGRAAKTFQALTDVNLEVKKGESLGIIGRNGAGKSTLLSIIAGTISPTEGRVESNGKISSLLELGAGFHPDLTGRENVFLYGSIMGIPRAEMMRRFDEIVEFAGIGEFIDQPVRFYSSGMYVRLGFSVAVQIDPDILLVDEVLAVGDIDFQRRCLRRMSEFRRSGKTLILISHDLGAIQSISDRIAILDHGTVIDVGGPGNMVDAYSRRLLYEAADAASEWGTRTALLSGATMLDPSGTPTVTFPEDGILRLKVDFSSTIRIADPVFGFSIARVGHEIVFGSNTLLEGLAVPEIDKTNGTVRFEIDASTLQAGSYSVSLSFHSSDHKTNYHRLENVISFTIEKARRDFDGIVTLPVKASVELP